MSHNLFFPHQLLIFSTYTRLYQNNYNNEVFIDCLTLITLSIAKKTRGWTSVDAKWISISNLNLSTSLLLNVPALCSCHILTVRCSKNYCPVKNKRHTFTAHNVALSHVFTDLKYGRIVLPFGFWLGRSFVGSIAASEPWDLWSKYFTHSLVDDSRYVASAAYKQPLQTLKKDGKKRNVWNRACIETYVYGCFS